jgi:4-hydroxyacetophenone monooxygenase
VQLKRAGIPYTVLEKNSGIGGTWYENRYPGARVDSPSRTYTHIYAADFDFPYPFGPQSENERYFNWMADTFEIRHDIEFDTEVKSLTWDEAAKAWEIHAEGPQGPSVLSANVVVSCVGFLSRPNIPALDGASDFRGKAFHTAAWYRDRHRTTIGVQGRHRRSKRL